MNDNDLKRLFRHATTEYLEEERDLCRATILNLKKAELWKAYGHRKIDNQIKDLMISVSFIGSELKRRNRVGE
jgi:hypothetical protein